MANCNLWRNFLLSGLLGAFLLAGTSFVRADDNKTLVGVVSTTHCGLKHSTADASGAACVNSCINSGRGAYALVVDGEIYTLEGRRGRTKRAGRAGGEGNWTRRWHDRGTWPPLLQAVKSRHRKLYQRKFVDWAALPPCEDAEV